MPSYAEIPLSELRRLVPSIYTMSLDDLREHMSWVNQQDAKVYEALFGELDDYNANARISIWERKDPQEWVKYTDEWEYGKLHKLVQKLRNNPEMYDEVRECFHR